jgi:hypothetical protein
MPDAGPTLHDLAARFLRQADGQFRADSPLYDRLARGVAADSDLLALAAHTRPDQDPPLLLLAAVHYLLLQEPDDPLAAYYPSVAGAAAPPGDPFPLFRAFCLRRQAAITAILAARLVQTNEAQRCASLLPAFGLVASAGGGRPLALVEIGPSAGLNLLWDRYAYDYGPAGQAGPADSPVRLACEARGDRLPPLPRPLPRVVSRVGVDLHPVDVRDAAAVRWLRALIWPDQAARADRFACAVALAQADPPRLVAGDALALLPRLLAEAPPGATLCVLDTFVVVQLAPEQRARLTALLAQASHERAIFRVSIDWPDTPHPCVELTRFAGGQAGQPALLAYTHAHGRWLEWLAGEPAAHLPRVGV